MEWHPPLLVWLEIFVGSTTDVLIAAIFFPRAVEVDGMSCGLLPTAFMEIPCSYIYIYTYYYIYIYILYIFIYSISWNSQSMKSSNNEEPLVLKYGWSFPFSSMMFPYFAQKDAGISQPGVYLAEELATWEDLNPDALGSKTLGLQEIILPNIWIYIYIYMRDYHNEWTNELGIPSNNVECPRTGVLSASPWQHLSESSLISPWCQYKRRILFCPWSF